MNLFGEYAERGCVPGGIIYVNGMTTTFEDAQQASEDLSAITGIDVELHHNDTTSAEKVTEMTVKAFAAIICCYGSYKLSQREREEKEQRDLTPAILIVAALAFIIWTSFDYSQIQTDKDESAKQLSDKIVRVLSTQTHVTLVLHSQGADIGLRALKQLANAYDRQYADLRERISVITIGGMVTINGEHAKISRNIQDRRDLISQVAHGIFDSAPGELTSIETTDCSTSLCHGSQDYLRHEFFQHLVRVLACTPPSS